MAGAFTRDQEIEIEAGKETGLDIDPYLSVTQRGMTIREIVLGLEERLDVSYYQNPRYS